MEIITTEFKDIKDLIKASRNVSTTVIAYRFGEIRVYENIAYIVSSLGRNSWYILYTKNHDIDEETELLEFTTDGELRKIAPNEMGRDTRAVYFTIIRPIKDDIIEPLIKKIKQK